MIATTEAIRGETRRCSGPCGRDLAPEKFRRNGRWRRTRCRDCEAGRPPIDAAGLIRRYDRLLSDWFARMIRWDDPMLEAVRAEVRSAILDGGPLEADGVRLGWDWRTGEITREWA